MDLDQPMLVSANIVEALTAFQDHAADAGEPLGTSLIWPRFTPDTSSTVTGLKHEVLKSLGVESLTRLAGAAGASPSSSPWCGRCRSRA